MSSSSATAYWMAAERARETTRSDRLFDDPWAHLLAGTEGFELMARMEAGLPPNPSFAIRTRYFDDALLRALASNRVRQVVLLGAGMDARAFRLDLPRVFEIDRLELLRVKEARLAAASAAPRCPRALIGVDLTGPWADDLAAAGFDDTAPTAFVAEGLLGYLDHGAVHQLLAVLHRLAAGGSWLVADVSGQSSIGSPDMAFWSQRLADNGVVAPRFGTDDPEGLLSSHGWRAHVVQYGDTGANYGRWPYPSIPRDDASLPHNYLMVGER